MRCLGYVHHVRVSSKRHVCIIRTRCRCSPTQPQYPKHARRIKMPRPPINVPPTTRSRFDKTPKGVKDPSDGGRLSNNQRIALGGLFISTAVFSFEPPSFHHSIWYRRSFRTLQATTNASPCCKPKRTDIETSGQHPQLPTCAQRQSVPAVTPRAHPHSPARLASGNCNATNCNMNVAVAQHCVWRMQRETSLAPYSEITQNDRVSYQRVSRNKTPYAQMVVDISEHAMLVVHLTCPTTPPLCNGRVG